MNIIIRQEAPKDHSEVEKLVQKAFENEPMSDQTEHLLVKRLRTSSVFIPELSLVAKVDANIAGHILLTKVTIQNEQANFPSLALAPVSVLPGFQGKGIGGRLIKEAHQRAQKLGFTSVVLIGHEDYYPRFGYKPAHTFGISFPFEAPPENCMAIELTADSLSEVSGEVVYPSAFFE